MPDGFPLPSAVVLDFDGVLADSEPLHLQAFQRVLGEAGIELTAQEYYERYLGISDEAALEAMVIDRNIGLNSDEARRLFGHKAHVLEALLAAPGVLFPGVDQRVREYAACLPLAIASGARREEIELVLEANDLSACFSAIVAAGETPRGKPAPDPYTRAIELLVAAGLVSRDVPRSRCVAVEDSRWGISSAKAAGLRCIGVATSYPADALAGADAVAPSLAHVSLDMLAEVARNGAGR